MYKKHKTQAPNVRAWPTISLGPTYCWFADPGSLVTTTRDAVNVNCLKALLAVLGPKLQAKLYTNARVQRESDGLSSVAYHTKPGGFPTCTTPHISLHLPDVLVVSLTVGHVLSVHFTVGSVQASAKANWAQQKRI